MHTVKDIMVNDKDLVCFFNSLLNTDFNLFMCSASFLCHEQKFDGARGVRMQFAWVVEATCLSQECWGFALEPASEPQKQEALYDSSQDRMESCAEILSYCAGKRLNAIFRLNCYFVCINKFVRLWEIYQFLIVVNRLNISFVIRSFCCLFDLKLMEILQRWANCSASQSQNLVSQVIFLSLKNSNLEFKFL